MKTKVAKQSDTINENESNVGNIPILIFNMSYLSIQNVTFSSQNQSQLSIWLQRYDQFFEFDEQLKTY